MFGNRRNYDDIFRAFEEMFSQFDSVDGEWKTQTKLSDDGTYRITSYYYGNNKDEKITTKSLQKQLDEAIENEDFEMAVKLRDQIKKIESNKKEIEELELDLKKSIQEQNFEKSIEIRDLLKKLK
jgi:protein-arginine kinase activator protein McsA